MKIVQEYFGIKRLRKSACGRKNPYYKELLFVENNILGDDAEITYAHTRGLRNFMNRLYLEKQGVQTE